MPGRPASGRCTGATNSACRNRRPRRRLLLTHPHNTLCCHAGTQGGPFIDGGISCRIGLDLWRRVRYGFHCEAALEDGWSLSGSSGRQVGWEAPPPAVVHLIHRSSPFSGNDSTANLGMSALLCAAQCCAVLCACTAAHKLPSTSHALSYPAPPPYLALCACSLRP